MVFDVVLKVSLNLIMEFGFVYDVDMYGIRFVVVFELVDFFFVKCD